jgi:hypothetical protein
MVQRGNNFRNFPALNKPENTSDVVTFVIRISLQKSLESKHKSDIYMQDGGGAMISMQHFTAGLLTLMFCGMVWQIAQHGATADSEEQQALRELGWLNSAKPDQDVSAAIRAATTGLSHGATVRIKSRTGASLRNSTTWHQ